MVARLPELALGSATLGQNADTDLTVRRTHRLRWLLALAALGGLAGGLAIWSQLRFPHRFGVVVPGALYRCGRISPAQLTRLQREYGIRRVISLLDSSAPETAAERSAAAGLQLEWHNVPLPGDGASTPADREHLRGLLLAPHAPPTLVHCAAGVNRTGLAIGIYRLHAQHWSLDRVLQELREWGSEDSPQHANLRAALAEEARAAPLSGTEPGIIPTTAGLPAPHGNALENTPTRDLPTR